MSDDRRLICGAMSGTSCDGVDAALVRVTGRGLAMTAEPIAHAYVPFAPELRSLVLGVRERGELKLSDLAAIGRAVTLTYVDACRSAFAKANVEARDVAAIAAHGQTLYHGPPNTIQYFDPSLLAIETNCAVVSDFRRADLAVGGQGAPLVPFADWILFRHPEKSRVILNIGGIANLTYLKAGGTIDDVIAFDTGPGNCLSDAIAREAGLPCGIDAAGATALRGTAHFPTAFHLARSAYIFKRPPKSTDGPEMFAAFALAIDQAKPPTLTANDRLATAAMAVAHSVMMSLDLWCDGWRDALDEVYVAGGGAHNAAIVGELRQVINNTRTTLSLVLPSLGGDVDVSAAREAIAFALLGAATLDGEPSNVPSATGASRRVILGSITPRPVAS